MDIKETGQKIAKLRHNKQFGNQHKIFDVWHVFAIFPFADSLRRNTDFIGKFFLSYLIIVPQFRQSVRQQQKIRAKSVKIWLYINVFVQHI